MTPETIEIAALLNGQAGSQNTGATKKANEGNAEQGFLQFLDKALGRGKKDELPWSQNIAQGVGSKEGWLESFRGALYCSGIGLKNMSLSSKALEGLKKLLLADGFTEDDVKGLLNGFLGSKAKKEISISELLHKIGELKGKSKEQSADFVLEPSALPYLEILLRSFGLDVRQIEGFISQARIDGGKLSLKALAQSLKTIVTDAAQVSAEGDKETLIRMGLAKEADMLNGPVSLERFVRLIEDKVASLVPYRLSDAEGKKQIAGLLENVSVTSQAKEDKNLASKRRGVELKGFPFQDLEGKTNSRQENTGISGEWEQARKKAAGANRSGAGTKGGIDIKEIDIKKLAQQEVNGNEMPARAEKLLEGGRNRPSEKTSDNNRWTATGVHDHAASRMSAAENIAKPDVRSIPLHVVNQVGRRLGMAVRRGENHVRLQLKPPHLGSIQLDLTMKDNGLKIAIVAEHQYVKDLMVSHVHELREALSNQGVELEKIDVEINQNFGQSMANADRESHSAQPWARRAASAFGEPGDETIGAHMMSQPMHGDGQVDMFA